MKFNIKIFSTIAMLLVVIFSLPLYFMFDQKGMSKDGVIQRDGVYRYKDGIEVSVSVVAGLVKYTVSKDEEKLISSNKNISTYQKWFIFWDIHSKELWVLSSDIGDSVWKRGESGIYYEENIMRGYTQWPKELKHLRSR